MTEFVTVTEDGGTRWTVNVDMICRVHIIGDDPAGPVSAVMLHVHDRIMRVIDPDSVGAVMEMVRTHQVRPRRDALMEQAEMMLEAVKRMVPHLFTEPQPYVMAEPIAERTACNDTAEE